jgi:uracil-DNA glycosylase family 4
MFTGDASGDILYRVLHATGFASQPEARRADDGLELRDLWITATAHCAPPDNKPTREEMLTCREFLVRELALLPQVQVVVALGKIAFDTWLDVLRQSGRIGSRSGFIFGHNVVHHTGPGDPILIASYHPSQQNTSTGKLTESMLRAVFERARASVR